MDRMLENPTSGSARMTASESSDHLGASPLTVTTGMAPLLSTCMEIAFACGTVAASQPAASRTSAPSDAASGRRDITEQRLIIARTRSGPRARALMAYPGAAAAR